MSFPPVTDVGFGDEGLSWRRIVVWLSVLTLVGTCCHTGFAADKEGRRANTGRATPQAELLGGWQFPGDSSDRSSLTGEMENGVPRNRLGGIGSGICTTADPDEFLVVSDRGPNDGADSFPCRWHKIRLPLTQLLAHPHKRPRLDLKGAQVLSTVLLRDATGEVFVGRSSVIDSGHPQGGLRFDPEAIRELPDGTVLVTDEYRPGLFQFSPDGTLIREIPLPENLAIRNWSEHGKDEFPPHNTMGRQTNRGVEGLAVSPEGHKAWVMLQSPLIQDGGLDEENRRVGRNIRITEVSLDGKTPSRQYVYRLEAMTNGVSEIEYVAPGRFLVLERDGKSKGESKAKLVTWIDLRHATDVSSIRSLPTSELPTSIRPVEKSLLINLLDPHHGLIKGDFPEKIEGLAVGPHLPDGRLSLLVATDNDFLPEHSMRIWAFALDPSIAK